MKRVLVTGANGQLGQSILSISGAYPNLEFVFAKRKDLDITKESNVISCFRELKPDYCINCAAYTQVDQAEKTPELAYEINVQGVENLVRACRVFDSTLIHISTDYVFDGKKTEGYLPWDVPNPINVYGKTKLEGEKIIQHDLDNYFIIRTSWLYSKKYPSNFYLTVLEKAKKGEPLSIIDSQKGCPTDTENLALYILELIQSGNEDYGISHFTDGVAMTWFQFAERIIEEAGLQGGVHLQKAENYHTIAQRPKNSVLHSKSIIDDGP